MSKLGTSYEDTIWNIPLSFLMLMLRERIAMEGTKKGMSLSTIQFIDNIEQERQKSNGHGT